MLNGAKYVKGELYTGKTIVPTEFGPLKCDISFKMISFDRKVDRFKINCVISPENPPPYISQFAYTMNYTYRLSDLILIKMVSHMSYKTDKNSIQKTMQLTSN